ncbi:MAG TPA: response regulator, partial [Kofleriaceae bacterium]|nr:response regulator [Kofleriaceae bacterium]
QRALLAEDSAITRSMLAGVLGDLGYQVLVARDGKEALAVLEQSGADVLLTDLDMPAVDGVDLIRRVRSDVAWKRLPIIVLSTRGTEADQRRAAAAGADAYLPKGEFSEARLREALGKEPFS